MSEGRLRKKKKRMKYNPEGKTKDEEILKKKEMKKKRKNSYQRTEKT